MKKVNTIKVLLVSLFLSLLAIPAAANTVLAEVENHGDALVFFPTSEFKELILTVTGPCDFLYRQVVTRGELVFRLDETTIDGAYSANLVRIEEIDSGIIGLLKEARLNADEETPKQLCRDGKLPGPPAVQALGFLVSKGKIIFDQNANEKALGPGPVDLDELFYGDLRSATESELMSKAPARGSSLLPTKDFVILDDLIVDGSACIGFDCVNGESFGFDTIRLKENNLRIKFDDTSVAASFPRTDWQLTANASANGGASKFSIDDISGSRTPFTVEANARSHSLYVDDGGRIGNRTSTPSTEIHTIDGDTPTLRLQQDGSSGFAPQTWDVAGNETNFFIRDVSNGSQLPFRIRPSAPTDSLFIETNGNIGIGTASPDADIHVLNSTGNAEFQFEAGSQAWKWRANGTTGQMNLVNDTASTTPFKIDDGAGTNALVVAATGVGINTGTPNAMAALDVDGAIYQRGGVLHADYVFEPDYELESVKEHSEFMWREGHLPAVPKRQVDENGNEIIEIGSHRRGMLEELEKAHIYIDQLHSALELQQESLEKQQESIRELTERLAQLEGSVR